jgi:hypothetical protein
VDGDRYATLHYGRARAGANAAAVAPVPRLAAAPRVRLATPRRGPSAGMGKAAHRAEKAPAGLGRELSERLLLMFSLHLVFCSQVAFYRCAFANAALRR